MIRGFTDSFMKVTSRNSFTFFRPFFLKLVLLPGVRSCPKNVQNMAPGHFSMRKKRNLQFRQNRARKCKSCELFKFGSFSPIQPTIPLRGGVKKILFFFTFCQKGGGGVSANPKNPYQKKLRWSKKGGGSQFFD